MSSVAITGNASGAGVFTIASPNSASSYTITLPTVTGGSFIASDASGNVGIGTTPSAWDSSSKALQFAGGSLWAFSTTQMAVTQNLYYNSSGNFIYVNTATASAYRQISGAHSWWNAPSGTAGAIATLTQAMTLNTSGTLLIGKTSDDSTTNGFTFGVTGKQVGTVSTGTNEIFVYNNTSTGGAAQIDFRTANVEKGYIQWDNTNTTYSTTSDYRLKENIAPMTGALAKVAALKPCTYSWKIDGSDGQGFIAHEVAEVVPQAVTGEKDGVREDGVTPRYQGIDTSFLVATLTAAMQEQQALITSLTARIAALEGA
jgi:hypothetical protein